MTHRYLLFLGLLGLMQAIGYSAQLYVSPRGRDSNRGTSEAPLASLAAARDAARTVAGKEPVTVHVADGVYYLRETLAFTSADSGSKQHPVVYRAENEGKAVLSGGARINLTWLPYKDGIFLAMTPSGLVIDQLFVDGKNQRMARYPNYDAAKKAEPYQGFAADAFSKERAANWADPMGGYIHAMHRASWGGYHYRITGKDSNGDVTYEGGWQNNRQMGMHEDYRMVENIFEELDAPGEWFHDVTTSTLYYKPTPDVDLTKASVEVVRLRHLVEFQGSQQSPVKYISLQGFAVRHAARTFMDCKEPLLRSDWAIYRGGAFLLTGTEDIRILDCEFDQVGGNAIFVNNYNRRTLVKGCHIHDTGASGVCFVGDPDAVRDPLFEYGQKNELSKIDRTAGPKTPNFPSLSAVEDCLIHGIGRVERQPAGVMIDMASEITIRDCSIYDCARAGINIGDGAWGGHLIERCDVFDTVLETHDHGSFNSWGRDRYWRSDHLTTSQRAVDAEPNLPFLDAVKTTVIRDSRWRCDHGWDIDLDDGSSNYDIYNNLLLSSGLKLREGFRRHAWNNIAPFGRLHPHVWFQRSKDQVTGNIFADSHATARMSTPYVEDTIVDRNLFASEDQNILKRSAQLGWDQNSMLGDPMFVDPAKGDFRVKEGSPALKLGFKNFPMDQFGVKKPALKAIARTPDLGHLSRGGRGRRTQRQAEAVKRSWLGAELGDLAGDAFSAYGVRKQDGGVAITDIPKVSTAAKSGLRANDLIQVVNETKVSNVDQLFTALSGIKSASVTLKVVRNQQPMELTVEVPTIVEMETASAPNGFVKLPVPAASSRNITANRKTNNDPLSTLTDGKLGKGFGPVFGNGIHNGAYKMDLGSVQVVKAITSWSFDVSRTRGAQRLTIYANSSTTDPGWDLNAFTQLGTIDTRGSGKDEFTAASLRTTSGQPLGNFRWIVWSVSPVSSTAGGENTAFQELAVDVVSQPGVKSSQVDKAARHYDGSWESLQKMPVPAWFDDGKIGIFIHWGPYSAIGYKKGDRGYAEHVPKLLYEESAHYYPYMQQRWGATPPEFGYKDIIPEFTAAKWNPDEWAKLFADVGAKYVVLTAEHHDGWANWDSDLTPWNAVDMGPKRDLVGDLGKAIRKYGLKYGPSYHRERHTGFFAVDKYVVHSQPRPDIAEEIKRVPQAASLYGPFSYDKAFVDDYVARWKEIQTKYQPDFLWMDDVPIFTRDGNNSKTTPPNFKPEIQYFYDSLRGMITDFMNDAVNRGREVYVNNKGANRNWPDGVGCLEKDNLKLKVIGPKWQSCTTFGTSFGYLEGDKYKTVESVIHEMVEVISRNGNFLINIGLKADGTLVPEQVERLRAMGKWLKINGDAIYATRYWKQSEQKDEQLAFTTKGKNLYAIKLAEPTAPFTITGTSDWNADQVKAVRLLGSDSTVIFKTTPAGLQITPPTDLGSSVYAWSFEIVTTEEQHHPSSIVTDAGKALRGTKKVDLEGAK